VVWIIHTTKFKKMALCIENKLEIIEK